MTEKIDDMSDSNSKKNSLINLFKKNITIYTAFVLFIFALSLYIRAVPPHDAVFRYGIIGFAPDDAVFHMRLVENALHHYPHRIWYEVFTLYPYGQSLHFGPLWTFMIATTSMILGGGSPSLELTRTVGAYLPAIFGALVVFPVYFIGREVFDRRVGLLSAFVVAVMPGQILSRSGLGFTDHHIGEVFFSTMFIMFFIMAVKSIKKIDFSLNDIRNTDWNKIRRPVILSIFTGIAFGLYMLQWCNGVFFGGIVAIFIVLQYIINHMRGKSNDGLSLVCFISFLVAFPLILIFVDPRNSFSAGRYSYLHILITAGSALFFLLLGLISVKMKEKNMKNIYYPLTIAAIYGVGLALSRILIPGIFSSFKTFFTIFEARTGGGQTIAEAQIPTHTNIFGDYGYPNNFGSYPGIIEMVSPYYLALFAMVIIGALLIFRKWEPEKSILLIWCIIIFGLTTGQNRWFYYYSVNVALLCSFLGIAFIDLTGINGLFSRFKSRVSTPQDISGFISSNIPQYLLAVLVIVIVITIVFLPNFTIASRSTAGGPTNSEYYQWYDSLNWMRYHTPDPGLDYDEVYDRPPAGETFAYPDTAYGVMSWWDYGHVITYFAHRIPNANPFQAGIGGGPTNAPGASTFFTSQSEEEADEVLWNLSCNDKPGSRYIISNAYMAYAINDIMAVWTQEYLFNWDNVPGNEDEEQELLRFINDVCIYNWIQDPGEWIKNPKINADINKSDDGKTIRIFKDMDSVEIVIDEIENKVVVKTSNGKSFYLKRDIDDDGNLTKNIFTEPDGSMAYRRYDVVMEGWPPWTFAPRWYHNMESQLHILDGNGLKHYRMVHESIPNPNARGGNMEQWCKFVYNNFYNGNLDVNNTGFVKIFEFVEGATISGSAPNGSTVVVSIDIMTNQNRKFNYTQTTTAADGTYRFVVPYSTHGPMPGETDFDTMPTGPYTITAAGISKTIDVNEADVLNGGSITIDLS